MLVSKDIPTKVLGWWFQGLTKEGPPGQELFMRWFMGGNETDMFIKNEFGQAVSEVADGLHDEALSQSPEGVLAMVICMDQFPRNIYRGKREAFRYDAKGLSLAKLAIERGFDQKVWPVQSAFFYLPFEHDESVESQTKSIALMDSLLTRAPENHIELCKGFAKYARDHAAIIERFGRYPHRNAVLGRASTAEEGKFLVDGGETFGQGQGTK